jgi:1-acyl-sn-glycerol-3-phosphate acyltransferase
MKVTGLENIPATGPVIFAGNHVSNLDGFALCIGVSGSGRWPALLGKVEVFRVPLLGRYLRACGMIPLDRSRGDVGALRAAEEILKEGGSMGLFPQGTRNGKSVKAGVGFLAERSGAPVVPVRLIGTDTWPRPGGLEVRVGVALRFEGEAKTFAQKVMDTIYSL